MFAEPMLPNDPVSAGAKRIEVGDFESFVLPLIRGREPSAVDLLAAVVDKEARQRVERQRAGTFPKLMPSDIVGVQSMTHRRQHR